MQPQCIDLCQNLRSFRPFLGFSHRNPSPTSNSLGFPSNGRVSSICCSSERRKPRNGERQRGKSGGGGRVKVKEKENVWSVDNELAKAEAAAEEKVGEEDEESPEEEPEIWDGDLPSYVDGGRDSCSDVQTHRMDRILEDRWRYQ
eukprot:TRINITY_DN5730_c0_g1_i2.p1 TRINITY_DN5730_c0_g1~~TRINITY_DN5730_c0_g1_i2.p1  ORF type:complete len:145 (+),score=39.80 TRINITY_DN5730_c0_g1_i2:201-635(+)